MRAGPIVAGAAVAVACLASSAAPAGGAKAGFENTTAITLPESGPASAYPSTITVSGLPGVVSHVEVVIPSLTHTFPADLDILLQGPSGQTMMLLSDTGGSDDVSGVALRFRDLVPPATAPLRSGTFAPTDAETPDTLAPPAPAGPYGTELAIFDGTAPNGEWKLYVHDDTTGDVGELPAGWSLEVTTLDPVCLDVPEDGFVDVPADNVHETNIDCLVAHGVAAGTTPTTFSPQEPVSRAQMATFVASTLEADGLTLPADPPDAFADDQGTTHERATNQLRALAVIGGNGESGSSYFPSADMRRDHMASFLYLAYEAATGQQLPDAPDAFTDDTGNPHEAAANALAAAGVLRGTGGGLYDPAGSVSRAQMATFLANFLDVLHRQTL